MHVEDCRGQLFREEQALTQRVRSVSAVDRIREEIAEAARIRCGSRWQGEDKIKAAQMRPVDEASARENTHCFRVCG